MTKIIKYLVLFLVMLPVYSYGITDTCPVNGWHVEGNIIKKVKATCTTRGYIVYECVYCDAHFRSDYTKALGHSTANGICSRCGKMISGNSTESNSTNIEANLPVKFLTKNGTYADGLLTSFGIENSVVQVNGENITVNTEYVLFSETVPIGSKFAYVYAPKSGKANLFLSPVENSNTICKCLAGTIIPVLGFENGFIKCYVNSFVGYIKETAIRYYPSVKTIKGVIKQNSVNIRLEPNKNAYKIASLSSGKLVNVIQESNGWYEIEVDGIHGYVQKKFVTLKN